MNSSDADHLSESVGDQSSLFDQVPEEMKNKLVNFTESVTNLENTVMAIMNSNVHDNYQTIGIDAKEHPIKKESERMIALLKRCQNIYAKQVQRKTKVNPEASGRVLKHALWQSAMKGKKKNKK